MEEEKQEEEADDEEEKDKKKPQGQRTCRILQVSNNSPRIPTGGAWEEWQCKGGWRPGGCGLAAAAACSQDESRRKGRSWGGDRRHRAQGSTRKSQENGKKWGRGAGRMVPKSETQRQGAGGQQVPPQKECQRSRARGEGQASVLTGARLSVLRMD